MRSISAFSLGVLCAALVFVAIVHAPASLGGDCPPGQAMPAPAPAPAAADPAAAAQAPLKPPTKEPAVAHPLLSAMVGEWGCNCAYPTGGHAAGDATVKLVMDGTAVMTESVLDWDAGGETKERIHNLGIWKVGADGKSLAYWGFSSHDADADTLRGEITDTSATVSGPTHWGPMRMTLSLKDGALTQQLWIGRHDYGAITYKKK